MFLGDREFFGSFLSTFIIVIVECLDACIGITS